MYRTHHHCIRLKIKYLFDRLLILLFLTVYPLTIYSATTPETPYEIIKILPHNKTLFTQGLEIKAGILYESAGHYGHSTINKINLSTGVIQQQLQLDNSLFAEGLTHLNHTLILLTWKSETALLIDADTFKIIGSHTYTGEGWGICYDGESLVTSNGSNQLTFRNPNDFRITRTISIMFNNQPLGNINELECTHGLIYANVWGQDIIAIINPSSGEVVSFIDLYALYDLTARNHNEVLNGIAYSSSENAFWVTGKNWSNLYLIKLNPNDPHSQ
ncbi:MAG: glutaminyl-peptide cyclotransferase [Methylococcales bacterium]|nr:glutaminyl-peptide cyclotransferase [Methylococcales bacterium]